MSGLHRERYANAERRQCHHRCRAHADGHHLSEDRTDFEELSGKWRDHNPVKQTQIKLEIVFHLPFERAG